MSYTSDLKTGIQVTALPDASFSRVSAKTGLPGINIL